MKILNTFVFLSISNLRTLPLKTQINSYRKRENCKYDMTTGVVIKILYDKVPEINLDFTVNTTSTRFKMSL